MKKTILYTFLIAVLTLSTVTVLKAQAPPHPNQQTGGSAPTGQRIGEGSGAPVGTADILLFVLAAAYAGRKTFKRKKEEA